MSGRFLFQNLSLRISSRSRSILSVGAHASVSGVASPEGGVGTLNSFVHGSAAHPIPSNCVIHRYEGRIGMLSNILRGAYARPSMATPGNSGVHGYAARYFNTLPWTCSVAKTSSPTNGMASAVAHRVKPAFVDPAGVKPTFSSNSSTKDSVTSEAKRAACATELQAKKLACRYRSASEAEREAENKAIIDGFKAWKAKLDKDADDFSTYVTRYVSFWTLLAVGFIFETNRRSYEERKSSAIAVNDNALVQDPSAS